MALSAQLDKKEYNPGDTMMLTVTTNPGDRSRNSPISIHIHIDENGLNIGPGVLQDVDLTATVVREPAKVVVTDSQRIWTLDSDDGAVAVFKATA